MNSLKYRTNTSETHTRFDYHGDKGIDLKTSEENILSGDLLFPASNVLLETEIAGLVESLQLHADEEEEIYEKVYLDYLQSSIPDLTDIDEEETRPNSVKKSRQIFDGNCEDTTSSNLSDYCWHADLVQPRCLNDVSHRQLGTEGIITNLHPTEEEKGSPSSSVLDSLQIKDGDLKTSSCSKSGVHCDTKDTVSSLSTFAVSVQKEETGNGHDRDKENSSSQKEDREFVFPSQGTVKITKDSNDSYVTDLNPVMADSNNPNPSKEIKAKNNSLDENVAKAENKKDSMDKGFAKPCTLDNRVSGAMPDRIELALADSESTMKAQYEGNPIISVPLLNSGSLQSKYMRALEEFKLLRSNLSENMEKNLNRTNNLLSRGSSGLNYQQPEHYHSQESLLRDPSESLLQQQILLRHLSHDSDVVLRHPQNARNRLQHHRHSDMSLDRRLPDDYLKYSPRTAQRLLSNNIDTRRSLPGQGLQVYVEEDQDQRRKYRESRSTKESSFDRYLRGTSVMEHEDYIPDNGYGGSENMSPHSDMHNGNVDRFSSRSGSVNSRSSSAMASVDSGVRMSFVGQHGSLVVVAIDFGTTFSGYAFSFTRDATSIHMMRKWEGGDPGVTNQKTPTTLLLKPDGTFHSFGFGARDFYHDLDPNDAKKWLYFDKFKMSLHSSAVSKYFQKWQNVSWKF